MFMVKTQLNLFFFISTISFSFLDEKFDQARKFKQAIQELIKVHLNHLIHFLVS
jgi:hypothetical protein